MGSIPENTEVTKEQLLSLLAEARETTALFAAWSGGLDQKPSEVIASIPYYLKWVDVANNAVEGLQPDCDLKIRIQLAEDLIVLMTHPLSGMIQAVGQYCKLNKIAAPPTGDVPKEIYAFKKFAIDYVSKALAMIKEAKK